MAIVGEPEPREPVEPVNYEDLPIGCHELTPFELPLYEDDWLDDPSLTDAERNEGGDL